MQSTSTERAVIGGGLFGCIAALTLAQKGFQTVLIARDASLMTNASRHNQARLHSGLHYPRSLTTAIGCANRIAPFRERYPSSIVDFDHYYGISKHESRTDSQHFVHVLEALGLPIQEVDPSTWFHSGTVSKTFRVYEPGIDLSNLADQITSEISRCDLIDVRVNTTVESGQCDSDKVILYLSGGSCLAADAITISAYAGTNAVRQSIGLSALPLSFELAELVMGEPQPLIAGKGFTVMDGNFWSLMPYGFGNVSSLSAVEYTPLETSHGRASFSCQERRIDCTPQTPNNCHECPVAPRTSQRHMLQAMAYHFKFPAAFTPKSRRLALKVVETHSHWNDSRPTRVFKEPETPVTTVFSGKISSILDIPQALS